MTPAYLIALVVVLGVAVLSGAFYIYRQERRLGRLSIFRGEFSSISLAVNERTLTDSPHSGDA